MITCKEAGILIEKRNAGKILFWERAKLRLHLLICEACTRYGIQSKWLDQVLKNAQNHDHFSDSEKENLKKTLQENQ